jgi:Fur family ferric uptake transcriptional regulator
MLFPEELQLLRQYIHSRNMRYTPERETIVDEIFSQHDHFSAEDLYQRLKDRDLPISRASIYRTIPLLIDAGLISQVFQENGQTYYEHIYGHERHCHLRCVICGRIEEFAAPSLDNLPSQLTASTNFIIDRYKLEVLGRCPECQKNKLASSPKTE